MTDDRFCKIPNWVVDDYLKQLTCNAVRVFVALSRFADYETNACYPSMRKLKKLLKCCNNSVTTGIDLLEKQGLLRRDRSRGQVNLYFIARTAEEARAYRETYAKCSTKQNTQNSQVFHKTEHPNRTGVPRDGTPPFHEMEQTVPRGGTEQDLDNQTQEELSLSLFSSQEGLSADAMKAAHRLLIQIRVRGSVPESLISQHTPESITNAIKNGLALQAFKSSVNESFNLPGYVIKTLNQAKAEGKVVKATKWRSEAEQIVAMTELEQEAYRDKKREKNHQRVKNQIEDFKNKKLKKCSQVKA